VVLAGLSPQLEILRDNGKSRKASWSLLVNKVISGSFCIVCQYIHREFAM